MAPQPSPAGNSNTRTAAGEVDRLLSELHRNLESPTLSLKEQEQILGRVKILGRDKNAAGPIFSKRGITIVSKYGLESEPSNASREALRCLANALLLNEPSRQIFVDMGYALKAADRLKVDNLDDEFLVSRILFLLTYNTNVDLNRLIDSHGLADSINDNLAHHAKRSSEPGAQRSLSAPMEDMSTTETLKLMFNIIHHHPELAPKFNPCIESVVSIIMVCPLLSPPLQPPISQLVNALLNLDLEPSEAEGATEHKSSPLFPSFTPEAVINRLVTILDKAIRCTPEPDLDEAAAPLFTLIRRFYEFAPPQVKSWMRRRLLPQDVDRDKPLGQSETIASKLLHLSCSPSLPTLRDNISSLLFELTDKDPNKFVKNIGYGFASGFLMSHNIKVPSHAEGHAGVPIDDNAEAGADVNPVTGQKLSSEERDGPKTDEMTDAEKEREAKRLFVLFERLRATGVVDVKNPVQQAIDEGRFEELPDQNHT